MPRRSRWRPRSIWARAGKPASAARRSRARSDQGARRHEGAGSYQRPFRGTRPLPVGVHARSLRATGQGRGSRGARATWGGGRGAEKLRCDKGRRMQRPASSFVPRWLDRSHSWQMRRTRSQAGADARRRSRNSYLPHATPASVWAGCREARALTRRGREARAKKNDRRDDARAPAPPLRTRGFIRGEVWHVGQPRIVVAMLGSAESPDDWGQVEGRFGRAGHRGAPLGA